MRPLLALPWLAACQAAAPPPTAPVPPPAPPSVHAELDALDPRRPVPLLPPMALHQKEQMRDHLLVVQEVVAAVAAEDWAAAEQAARRMGTSPEMAMTCERMGAAAPGFNEQAQDFHRRADAIAAGARAHDGPATLRATADTLQACTTCHETWRQQVVTAEDLAAAGGGGPPGQGETTAP